MASTESTDHERSHCFDGSIVRYQRCRASHPAGTSAPCAPMGSLRPFDHRHAVSCRTLCQRSGRSFIFLATGRVPSWYKQLAPRDLLGPLGTSTLSPPQAGPRVLEIWDNNGCRHKLREPKQSQVGATSAAKQSASPRFAMPPGDFVKRVLLAHLLKSISSLAHGRSSRSGAVRSRSKQPWTSIQKKSRSSPRRCSLLSKL